MVGSLAVTTRSPEETRILGASLAPTLLPGDVLSLSGDLGAGKTVFVQGVAGALGVQNVTSPSFTIIQEYEARYPIVHMDVYRLNSFQEVLDLGFEELFDRGSVLIVEWGEAIRPLLPPRHLAVDIFHPDDPDIPDQRRIFFTPAGEEWDLKVATMRTTAEALLDAASPEGSGQGPRFEVAARPTTRDDKGKGRT